MTDPFIPANSLVLYRTRPARVAGVSGDKLAIEIDGGETAKVRPKDVALLHPGPLPRVMWWMPAGLPCVNTGGWPNLLFLSLIRSGLRRNLGQVGQRSPARDS